MIVDLKAYPRMKDSGVPWLGEVPEQWKVRRLRNEAEMRVSNVDKHVKDDEISVRLCNYVDVYKNDYINGRMDFMRATATEEEIERFRLEKDDVLITKDSETWDDIGVPALVTEPAVDLVSGYHLALLRSRPDKLVGAYLLRALQSKGLAYQFHIEAKGVTRYGLSHTGIKSVWIPLPSLSEQQAIVRFLDQADRRIRRYIRAKERLIELLEEQKQAIIHQAVTGQIDIRTGQPYPVYKDSGVEWQGQVPAHWEVCTLGRIAESFRTGPFGSMLHQSDYVEDGTPVINPIHMNNGAIIEDPSCSVPETVAERLSSYRLCLHDLVFSRRGELGRCAIVRSREVGWLCGTGSIRVRIERKRIVPKFLIQTLQVRWVGEYLSVSSVGATMDNLNTSILKGVPLLVPPIQQQKDIVEHIGQRTTTIDYAVRKSVEEICLIRQFRTRLIADIVTGQLDVREAAAAMPHELDAATVAMETIDLENAAEMLEKVAL